MLAVGVLCILNRTAYNVYRSDICWTSQLFLLRSIENEKCVGRRDDMVVAMTDSKGGDRLLMLPVAASARRLSAENKLHLSDIEI